MSAGRLPDPFRDLEPLVEGGWSLPTERERQAKRHASRPAELRAFYERFGPRLEAVVDHLDARPEDAWDDADRHLFWLLLAMAEVSFAVEKFDADESSYRGIAADRFVAVHELPDGGLPVPEHYR